MLGILEFRVRLQVEGSPSPTSKAVGAQRSARSVARPEGLCEEGAGVAGGETGSCGTGSAPGQDIFAPLPDSSGRPPGVS